MRNLTLTITLGLLLAAFGCRGQERPSVESTEEAATPQMIEQASEAVEAAPAMEATPTAADVAAQIRSLLSRDLGTRISDLQVEFDGTTVSLAGVCDSEATKQQALRLARSVSGVTDVNAGALSVRPPEVAAQLYTVRAGDWLSKIARRYYGDPMRYPVIFEANRSLISDPNLIYPGQSLRIPAAEAGGR